MLCIFPLLIGWSSWGRNPGWRGMDGSPSNGVTGACPEMMPCSRLSQLAATSAVELAGGCPARSFDHMFLSIGKLQSPCMVCCLASLSSLTAAETLGGCARWHGSRPCTKDKSLHFTH